MSRKKVLVTGAAGRIGQVLRRGLAGHYDLRLMYHRTVLEAEEGEEGGDVWYECTALATRQSDPKYFRNALHCLLILLGNLNFTRSHSPRASPLDSASTGFEAEATLSNQG